MLFSVSSGVNALSNFFCQGSAKPARKVRVQFRLCCATIHKESAAEDENMRENRSFSALLLLILAVLSAIGCNSQPSISGVWKGSIQASERDGKNKWQGPAELTLNQNGDAITGSLSFTHPQGGRVQVPITSGIVSNDSLTFSGQNQFPLGGSIELTFHGKVNGASLAGTTDMTSRGLFGTVANRGPLTLAKQ
jgi:hypothetical protein